MITYADVHGWFVGEELFNNMVNKYPDGSLFVEIGCYMGKSTCYMAQTIKKSNKKIRFDTIDHFHGSDETVHKVELEGKNLYKIFMKNMKDAEVLDIVHAISMDSVEAAPLLYDDNSIDYLFLDASHDYDSVKRDIAIWLPKIKVGGTISGDDYIGNWPGLMKAVDEAFGKTFSLSRINWFVEKK